MSRKAENDVVEFGDIYDDMPESKKMADLVGETFVITDASFGVGQYGEYALVTLSGEEVPYRTSSKVLVKQLKATIDHIKQNGVRVTLGKQKTKAGREIMTFSRTSVDAE